MTTSWLVRRLLYAAITLVVISLIVFSLVRMTGDPVLLFLPQDASQDDITRVRRQFGFEDPLPQQYGRFLLSALRGDLGVSIKFQEPVLNVVSRRVPATVLLASAAMLLTLAVALPAGILSALRRNSPIDRLTMTIVVLGQSMPSYWLGVMLILLVSVHWRLLPAFGYGTLAHLILPTVTLSAFFIARIARLTRSGMLAVLKSDYIRTAEAKGLPATSVVLKHALKNAGLPIVTIIGIEFGTLLGGTVITETIFAWPGLGRLAVDAIYGRDYPVVQTIVLLVSAIFVTLNLLVDVLYHWIDPRIELA
jgi:ABC-type dipeptide/oligopeptide/nickel transport system permease component